MERVLWIGPKNVPGQLEQALDDAGADLLEFPTVDQALAAVGTLPIAVAVIGVDTKEVLATVATLVRSSPGTQVLAATDVHVAPQVLYALKVGAAGVLDLRDQPLSDLVAQIQSAIAQFQARARERELLLRLRSLNEDFLKNMVASERRNLELEQKLHPSLEKLASEDAPGRVLIVDDEPTVCQVLEAILAKKGHQFVTVDSGEKAVAALQQQEPFNVVITDKNLPGMSGLQVLQKAKELQPETDVVVMTGYANTESAIEALNLGASGYLEKPFDHIKTVLEKIETVLEHQRERVRRRHYLHAIKERHRSFLDQYRTIRSDLESWLESRGVPAKSG